MGLGGEAARTAPSVTGQVRTPTGAVVVQGTPDQSERAPDRREAAVEVLRSRAGCRTHRAAGEARSLPEWAEGRRSQAEARLSSAEVSGWRVMAVPDETGGGSRSTRAGAVAALGVRCNDRPARQPAIG